MLKQVYLIGLLLLSGCGSDFDRDNNGTTPTNTITTISVHNNTAVQNAEAAVLFERCQTCHGQSAEKHALQKSDVIADYRKQDIIDALKAYKNGTRNIHGFGMLMKGQVAELSDYEITILSDYIAQF